MCKIIAVVVVLFQLISIFSILFGYVNTNEFKTKEKEKLPATYTFFAYQYTLFYICFI